MMLKLPSKLLGYYFKEQALQSQAENSASSGLQLQCFNTSSDQDVSEITQCYGDLQMQVV